MTQKYKNKRTFGCQSNKRRHFSRDKDKKPRQGEVKEKKENYFDISCTLPRLVLLFTLRRPLGATHRGGEVISKHCDRCNITLPSPAPRHHASRVLHYLMPDAAGGLSCPEEGLAPRDPVFHPCKNPSKHENVDAIRDGQSGGTCGAGMGREGSVTFWVFIYTHPYLFHSRYKGQKNEVR